MKNTKKLNTNYNQNFDKLLKAILLNDLKNFKSPKHSSFNQGSLNAA